MNRQTMPEKGQRTLKMPQNNDNNDKKECGWKKNCTRLGIVLGTMEKKEEKIDSYSSLRWK